MDRAMLQEASELLAENKPYLSGRLAGLAGRVPDGATNTIERPMSEIIAAEKEFFDKRWYDRSMSYVGTKDEAETPEDIRTEATRQRRRVEKEYGKENLGPYTDFEWGELAGKHAAMRWVLCPDIDWDADWLGDT